MKIKQASRNVIVISDDTVKAGWEQWFLLSTDRHHDNEHCDRALEKKHLEEARKRKALIIDNGDLFCAMQGKWDKRSDQDQMPKALQGNNYLDRLVEFNADFYLPYADLFLCIAKHSTHAHNNKREGQEEKEETNKAQFENSSSDNQGQIVYSLRS